MTKILILSIASFAVVVNGHGQMTFPSPRPAKDGSGNAKAVCDQNDHPMYTVGPQPGPRKFDPSYMGDSWANNWKDSDMQCRGISIPSSDQQVLRAGEMLKVKMKMRAFHPGTCNWYLSKPVAKAGDTPSEFYKIHEYGGCGSTQDSLERNGRDFRNDNVEYSFKLPDHLPRCKHCVLRWEWIATHQDNNEMYTNCADVSVVNDNGDYQVASGMTSIGTTGALDHTNWKSFGPSLSDSNFFGPALATYNADGSGSSSTGETIHPTCIADAIVLSDKCVGGNKVSFGIGEFNYDAMRKKLGNMEVRFANVKKGYSAVFFQTKSFGGDYKYIREQHCFGNDDVFHSGELVSLEVSCVSACADHKQSNTIGSDSNQIKTSISVMLTLMFLTLTLL